MIVEQRRLINPSDASRTKPVIVTFAGSFILFGEKCDIRADGFNEAEGSAGFTQQIRWKIQPDRDVGETSNKHVKM